MDTGFLSRTPDFLSWTLDQGMTFYHGYGIFIMDTELFGGPCHMGQKLLSEKILKFGKIRHKIGDFGQPKNSPRVTGG